MKVATIGFSGSGKSYISSILNKHGFHWLRTDTIRKELFGSIYDENTTHTVYEELIKRATSYKNAVLDGAFLKRWQRALVMQAFPEEYFFILVKAQEEDIKKRLITRKDISDANFSVYLLQKNIFEPPDEIPPHKLLTIENNDNSNIENIITSFLKAKNLL